MGTTASVYAAPAATSVPASAYIHKQVTKQALPATLCKQLKAQLPQKASDPTLCIVVHTELSTGFIPSKQSSSVHPLLANGCYAGTQSFRDTYFTGTMSVALNTNWSWDGSCHIPNITYEDCHINWTAFSTVTQTGCGSYTTSVPSRAALWTGWQQIGPIGSRVWARRECYVNVNCNYAQG